MWGRKGEIQGLRCLGTRAGAGAQTHSPYPKQDWDSQLDEGSKGGGGWKRALPPQVSESLRVGMVQHPGKGDEL